MGEKSETVTMVSKFFGCVHLRQLHSGLVRRDPPKSGRDALKASGDGVSGAFRSLRAGKRPPNNPVVWGPELPL